LTVYLCRLHKQSLFELPNFDVLDIPNIIKSTTREVGHNSNMAVEYQQQVQNSDYSNPTVLIIGAGISGKDP